MMIQLNPPLPITTDEFGSGWAHILIDYGCEADLLWVCFFDRSGICVTVNNCKLKIQNNWSLCRWNDKRNFADVVERKTDDKS